MADLKKRNTVKMLGVGGLLATTSSLVNAAMQGSGAKKISPKDRTSDLEILIVDSNDFEYSTVVVTNRTSSEIRLSEFTHSIIAYDNKVVDLNTTPFVQKFNSNDLVLAANHSASAFVVPAKSAGYESMDILSAQSSVSNVGTNTRVVNLGATLSGGSAIVHPSHDSGLQLG